MTNRGIKIRGIILIVLGAALAIGMIWLLSVLGPAMQGDGSPDLRFSGTADDARLINYILIAVLGLGLLFASYGIFMIVTGRESRVMKIAAVVLLIALVIGALLSGETVRLGPILQLLGR